MQSESDWCDPNRFLVDSDQSSDASNSLRILEDFQTDRSAVASGSRQRKPVWLPGRNSLLGVVPSARSAPREMDTVTEVGRSYGGRRVRQPGCLVCMFLLLVVAFLLGLSFNRLLVEAEDRTFTAIGHPPEVVETVDSAGCNHASSKENLDPDSRECTLALNAILDRINISLLPSKCLPALRSTDLIDLPDFASISHGAKINPLLTLPAPSSLGGGWIPRLQNVMRSYRGPYADVQIPLSSQDNGVSVAQPWCFPGAAGQLGVLLSQPIFVSHVTVDQPLQGLISNATSVPRDIMLWGQVDGLDNSERVRSSQSQVRSLLLSLQGHPIGPSLVDPKIYLPLAQFQYNASTKAHSQTFPVLHSLPPVGIDFGAVIVQILSNWGGETTCVPRVRIHGTAR